MEIAELKMPNVAHIAFRERVFAMQFQEILVLAMQGRGMGCGLPQRNDHLAAREELWQQPEPSDIGVVLAKVADGIGRGFSVANRCNLPEVLR